MENSLRTTELRRQEGLVKEAALEALGGDPSLGYTLVASSPGRSMSGLKGMGLGAFLVLAALVYTAAVVIQKAFGDNTWTFYWGWDLVAFAAGIACLGVGIRKFFWISIPSQAVAVFDGAVLRTGSTNWFTQRLSGLVYAGQVVANIVVRYPVHHTGKNKPVDLDLIISSRWQVENVLDLMRLGVEVVWLTITSKIATLCAEAVPAGDYDTVMAADLQANQEWQQQLYQAFLASNAAGPLACLSLVLADVRPPEYLRQEEEKARQARQAEEQRVANHRSVFETRRQSVTSEADFGKIVADIRAAALPDEAMAEEVAATTKAKREFKENAKRLENEARERLRQAARGPVQAFLTGLEDAAPLLDELQKLYHEDPVRMALFVEAHKLAGGGGQAGSSMLSLSDVAREQARLNALLADDSGGPRKLPFRFADEAGEGGTNGQVVEVPGPTEDKEQPLASTG